MMGLISVNQTAPARIDFALFSPLRVRPDPEELVSLDVRDGIQGCWVGWGS